MVKTLTFGSAERVYSSAKANAAGRFMVGMDETEDGWDIYGEGEAAIEAEYGRGVDQPPDNWATRAVMGGVDGRT